MISTVNIKLINVLNNDLLFQENLKIKKNYLSCIIIRSLWVLINNYLSHYLFVVIIMCANPKSIREIMIAAEELNMIENGEYVFFNIEIFGSLTKESKPWFELNDTNARNEQARKAYQALLTITTKKPEDEEYQEFSKQVKLLAEEKYNYTFEDHEEISQFVSAFHDAVLLFAKALNESIRELGSEALLQPLNGTRLTQLMWGTSFRGITGNVSMTDNGDRLSDYSLLDMNPNNSHFEIVANYFHSTGLTFVDGKKIHWAGGKTEPPADRPKCGFDNSLCLENNSTMFAILSLILGFIVIIMAVVSFLSYRHYKLEAEISSMTWKVSWNEVIPVPLAHQLRSSIHSRAGSQVVRYLFLCLKDFITLTEFYIVCLFRRTYGRWTNFHSDWMLQRKHCSNQENYDTY